MASWVRPRQSPPCGSASGLWASVEQCTLVCFVQLAGGRAGPGRPRVSKERCVPGPQDRSFLEGPGRHQWWGDSMA